MSMAFSQQEFERATTPGVLPQATVSLAVGQRNGARRERSPGGCSSAVLFLVLVAVREDEEEDKDEKTKIFSHFSNRPPSSPSSSRGIPRRHAN